MNARDRLEWMRCDAMAERAGWGRRWYWRVRMWWIEHHAR